jgi:hypothetical protein
MRRSTAKVKNFAGVASIILALPLSFAVAAETPRAEVSALAAYAQSTSVLDAWRNYALADLTRGFDWAIDGAVTVSAPTLFNRGFAHGGASEQVAHFSADPAAFSPLSVSLFKTKAADTPLFVPAEQPSLLQEYTPGLQRYILAPSFAQRWGEHSAFSVSAIFAYQRFAGLGLGQDSVPVSSDAGFASVPFAMTRYPGSYGTGMRLDFNSALTERLSWQMGVQSRVNMDAFNNYHGVYSEPGSFDIPASANAGIGVALAPQLTFDLGVERVMYSNIAPFTSAALPTRFLVLLGSSISPTFAWQNLDVYSAGWTWLDPSNGVWSLHYTTREQPLPTSPLLQAALEPYLASHNIEFGFARGFGRNSDLHLAASYAPSEFVLGLPTSNQLRNAAGGSQIEYQALWTTRF